MPDRVLVIKLGALGDVVQALAPFAAIRAHHAGAHITLLTTGPFTTFAEACGSFDEVWTDNRPKAGEIGKWRALRRRLRGAAFSRVYDLQTSDRSSFYFRLFWPGPWPEWSGIARGCSHPHGDPNRDTMHTVERQAEQLRMAGVADIPPVDLSWADADISRFGLSVPYVLLVPGGAAHRPAKRWPKDRYATLASELAGQGIGSVILGGEDERAVANEIATTSPKTLNLSGQTDLFDIAALARNARGAIGNDTGPMHLIAAAGCPSVVLYSYDSDPALCAQRGTRVTILRRPILDDLAAEEVQTALDQLASA